MPQRVLHGHEKVSRDSSTEELLPRYILIYNWMLNRIYFFFKYIKHIWIIILTSLLKKYNKSQYRISQSINWHPTLGTNLCTAIINTVICCTLWIMKLELWFICALCICRKMVDSIEHTIINEYIGSTSSAHESWLASSCPCSPHCGTLYSPHIG